MAADCLMLLCHLLKLCRALRNGLTVRNLLQACMLASAGRPVRGVAEQYLNLCGHTVVEDGS